MAAELGPPRSFALPRPSSGLSRRSIEDRLNLRAATPSPSAARRQEGRLLTSFTYIRGYASYPSSFLSLPSPVPSVHCSPAASSSLQYHGRSGWQEARNTSSTNGSCLALAQNIVADRAQSRWKHRYQLTTFAANVSSTTPSHRRTYAYHLQATQRMTYHRSLSWHAEIVLPNDRIQLVRRHSLQTTRAFTEEEVPRVPVADDISEAQREQSPDQRRYRSHEVSSGTTRSTQAVNALPQASQAHRHVNRPADHTGTNTVGKRPLSPLALDPSAEIVHRRASFSLPQPAVTVPPRSTSLELLGSNPNTPTATRAGGEGACPSPRFLPARSSSLRHARRGARRLDDQRRRVQSAPALRKAALETASVGLPTSPLLSFNELPAQAEGKTGKTSTERVDVSNTSQARPGMGQRPPRRRMGCARSGNGRSHCTTLSPSLGEVVFWSGSLIIYPALFYVAVIPRLSSYVPWTVIFVSGLPVLSTWYSFLLTLFLRPHSSRRHKPREDDVSLHTDIEGGREGTEERQSFRQGSAEHTAATLPLEEDPALLALEDSSPRRRQALQKLRERFTRALLEGEVPQGLQTFVGSEYDSDEYSFLENEGELEQGDDDGQLQLCRGRALARGSGRGSGRGLVKGKALRAEVVPTSSRAVVLLPTTIAPSNRATGQRSSTTPSPPSQPPPPPLPSTTPPTADDPTLPRAMSSETSRKVSRRAERYDWCPGWGRGPEDLSEVDEGEASLTAGMPARAASSERRTPPGPSQEDDEQVVPSALPMRPASHVSQEEQQAPPPSPCHASPTAAASNGNAAVVNCPSTSTSHLGSTLVSYNLAKLSLLVSLLLQMLYVSGCCICLLVYLARTPVHQAVGAPTASSGSTAATATTTAAAVADKSTGQGLGTALSSAPAPLLLLIVAAVALPLGVLPELARQGRSPG